MKAIEMNQLTKSYTADKKALDSISFTLNKGAVFGFLGPNGAGKTTAIKLLNGMLAPSGGECRVFDIDPSREPERIHQRAGVVTEHAQMYDNLTGIQNLVFYGCVFGGNAADSEKRAKQLLETLRLTDAMDKKLAAYSTGMRQRLSLARAMIHQPDILFLDEPTSGLDPESAQTVNNLIKNLAETEGMTVFLCTHQLRYAQEICSTYGLIDQGVLLASGTLEELRGMVESELIVRIHTDQFPAGLPVIKSNGQYYEMKVQTEKEIPALVKRIVEAGGNIYHVSAHSMTLEEIYFTLIEKRDRQGGAR